MSRIVSLYRIPSHIKTLAEIPDDFVPPPLGSGEEVLALLRDPSFDLINRICARTGWRAFDPEDGRLISAE
jgi:hypothetical protein